jgi:hypothetical protein
MATRAFSKIDSVAVTEAEESAGTNIITVEVRLVIL